MGRAGVAKVRGTNRGRKLLILSDPKMLAPKKAEDRPDDDLRRSKK
jgi:hypothetical protein